MQDISNLGPYSGQLVVSSQPQTFLCLDFLFLHSHIQPVLVVRRSKTRGKNKTETWLIKPFDFLATGNISFP